MFQIIVKWTVLACALLLLFPADASAQEIKGSFSGSGFNSADDSNDDGEASSVMEFNGRFSLFGRFTARSRGENLPWDGSSFCSPTEIRFAPLSIDTIFTTENGDMIYTQLYDGGSSNDLCFDVVDGSFRRTFQNQFIGGTGRFADASGYISCDLTGKGLYTPLGDIIGFTFEGECEGELE